MSQKWSYSRWSMYHQCPSQYEWHYIIKMPRGTPGPALLRGIDIHKKAENYVNGIITGMPNELVKFKKEFQTLRKEFKAGRGFTEPDISINSNLELSNKFDTDYFIGFADFAHFSDVVTVIDYKTGRKYPGHRDQGHVYSMALLCINSEIKEINVEFWYLDSGDTTEFHYERKNLNDMLALWKRRIDKMYADKKFEATPNRFCGWCARHKKNGGDCDG